ncbi:MAG: Mov34/MPN/PAD-1 family protein [Armatimonadetes bacterium]|nr:Mov34/MPN/PAD-1 family protein [Armatimonadota bacterium]
MGLENEENNIRVELYEANPESTSRACRPEVGAWIGCKEARPKVYFDYRALLVIVGHGLESPQSEVGGLLVGRVRNDGGKYVLVTASIPARHNRESASRLTFTHESWNQMISEMERDHPGCGVVGWYHTHPGHRIFLSEHDLFVHRNFFAAEHQVAAVFDPLKGEFGLFGWLGGRIERYQGIPIVGGCTDDLRANDVSAPCITLEKRTPEMDNLVQLLETAKADLEWFLSDVGMLVGHIIKPLDERLDDDTKGRHFDRKA